MTTVLDEISIADFAHSLDVSGRRLPWDGTIETSFRCNLNCVHCYVNKPAGDAEEMRRELSTERVKTLIDEVADAGAFELLLTGGEVLIRRDFKQIYLHALGRGLRVGIFTNATMVTEDIADFFSAHRPAAIEVTLYGMTKATYDRVTRVPGSFEKCIAGIERLYRRGLNLKLKTMVLSWNVHEIEAMRAFAASLGTSFRHDSLLNARVDCGANRNGELQVNAEDILAVDLADELTRAKIKNAFAPAAAAAGGEVRIAVAEQVFECGAGQMSFTVDPYGQLQLCQLARKASYDLKQGSFDTGWNEFLPQARSRQWQDNSVCQSCTLRSGCGNCPGSAELATGDPTALLRNFCEVTHLRAFAALGKDSGHRRDATCCVGAGVLAARPDADMHLGGCGSCSHSQPAQPQAQALIQIERPVRAAAAAARS